MTAVARKKAGNRPEKKSGSFRRFLSVGTIVKLGGGANAGAGRAGKGKLHSRAPRLICTVYLSSCSFFSSSRTNASRSSFLSLSLFLISSPPSPLSRFLYVGSARELRHRENLILLALFASRGLSPSFAPAAFLWIYSR